MQPKKDVKLLLAESFKELVLEKPVEKITIKEITDRAGVIRVTFYNHFQDKYELLEWICREEIVNPVRMLLLNSMARESISFIFTSILKNREFYGHVAKLEGQNSFESIVGQCIREVVTDYIEGRTVKKQYKYEWLTPEWIAKYYSQNLTFGWMSWSRDGMRVPPAEMVEMYEYIASHSMVDLPVEF